MRTGGKQPILSYFNRFCWSGTASFACMTQCRIEVYLCPNNASRPPCQMNGPDLLINIIYIIEQKENLADGSLVR